MLRKKGFEPSLGCPNKLLRPPGDSQHRNRPRKIRVGFLTIADRVRLNPSDIARLANSCKGSATWERSSRKAQNRNGAFR